MKLFNNLNQQLSLIDPGQNVKIFSCGPTVYDHIHIGNARPLILADLIIRNLICQGKQVDYLQNITDIDDKIIARARELNINETTLADKYTASYLSNLKNLNVITPNKIIAVSQVIAPHYGFIQHLIDQNDAYVTEGSVYFRVSNYFNRKELHYNDLVDFQSTDLKINQQRNAVSHKEAAVDFVLWKATSTGIQFKSPWGLGRPGWHTECAVINNIYFQGTTIDLHLGGIDLKFPHHTNERIQYIAFNNRELARVWSYNGHVKINNLKMSKSLNNMIYLHDFLDQYSPEVLRYIFYNSKYSRPLSLSTIMIDEAIKAVAKINKTSQALVDAKELLGTADSEVKQWKALYIKSIYNHLNQDLNSANVITLVHKLIKIINTKLHNKTITTSHAELWDHVIYQLLGFNKKH